MTSGKSCASWSLSVLSILWEKEVCYLHPILQTRKQRLDPGPLALLEQVRCESSLQTLLAVSRAVATKSTPREGESLHRAALGGSPKTLLCSYTKSQYPEELRGNDIHALSGQSVQLANRETEPRKGA